METILTIEIVLGGVLIVVGIAALIIYWRGRKRNG